VFPTPNPAASQISQMQALDLNMGDSPRLHQWNVNTQRELFSGTSVTLAYVGSRGDHLQRQRDTNPVTPRTLPDGTVVYGSRSGTQTLSNPRVNPQFAALISANTYAKSDYHSFQAALNRRFSSNVQSQLSYTLSRCRDTTSGNSLFEGGTAATNPYDEEYDYGPCLIDRTHNLRASAIYQLPFQANAFVSGWQLSTIVSAVSGAPFTPVARSARTSRRVARSRMRSPEGSSTLPAAASRVTSIRPSSACRRQALWVPASVAIHCGVLVCSRPTWQ
jgi:hypothetical protein